MNRMKQEYEIEFDEHLQLGYLRFSREKVVRSITVRDDLLVLDYDVHANLVGVEILSLPRLLAHTTPRSTSTDVSWDALLPALILAGFDRTAMSTSASR